MSLGMVAVVHVLAALLAVGGAPARPPTPEEARLYDQGAGALAKGDARGAEKAWRAGYAIAHDPAFLVHIGEAEEKAGARVQAAETYRRYLIEVPDASDKADITQRLARLGQAAPATPATSAVAAPPTPAAARPASGTPPPVAGTPRSAPVAPSPPPAAKPAAAQVDTEHPPQATEEDSGWNRYNATAMIASGVTVALLGTAAFYAALASSKENDVNRLVGFHAPPTPYSAVAATYTSVMAEGPRDAHDARVALVAAAATSVVAAVFFVLDAVRTPTEGDGAPAPASTVSLAPAGLGLGIQGAWSWRF